VTCRGRSSYKKALEQDINLTDIQGTELRDVIIEICEMIGLPYTSDSISPISTADFPARNQAEGLGEVKKADDVFSSIMIILNKANVSKYVMYTKYDDTIEDNVLYVNFIPTEYIADFVMNYSYYQSIGGLRKNYDKMLKTITVTNEKKPITAETLLLTSATLTSGQTETLDIGPPAMVTRFEVQDIVLGTATGGISDVGKDTVTATCSIGSGQLRLKVYGSRFASKIVNATFDGGGNNLDDLSNTGTQYSGGGSARVSVWIDAEGTPDTFNWDSFKDGVKTGPFTGIPLSTSKTLLHENIYVWWDATTGHTLNNEWEFTCQEDAPEKFAVSVDDDNMNNNQGISYTSENKIIYDTAEALAIADGMIEAYGDPVNQANSIAFPYLNLLLEQNDVVLLWTLNTFNDDLYFMNKVAYQWNRGSRATEGTKYSIDDTGLNFNELGDGTFTYDNYYTDSREIILKYDIGYLYDMMYPKQSTDEEIDELTIMEYNIRC